MLSQTHTLLGANWDKCQQCARVSVISRWRQSTCSQQTLVPKSIDCVSRSAAYTEDLVTLATSCTTTTTIFFHSDTRESDDRSNNHVSCFVQSVHWKHPENKIDLQNASALTSTVHHWWPHRAQKQTNNWGNVIKLHIVGCYQQTETAKAN